jgi:hypothetical protein
MAADAIEAGIAAAEAVVGQIIEWITLKTHEMQGRNGTGAR